MRVGIEPASIVTVRRLIAKQGLELEEQRALDINLAITSKAWVGLYEGEAACAFGLIPPTLLSDQARLWLHTTDVIEGNEFLFVRWSQRVIELLLEDYPTITGETKTDNPKTIRWLKWLGATFEHPMGAYLPFSIRKKLHG